VSPENTLLEAETHEIIDQKLISAGWVVQDKQRLNLMESLGVASLNKRALGPYTETQ